MTVFFFIAYQMEDEYYGMMKKAQLYCFVPHTHY